MSPSAPGSGRAVATADFDRDGDVDVAVGQLDQPQLLLANEGQSAGNWIELRLVGRASARDACGAIVRVRAGGKLQQRQVACRAGAKEVHFGLAEASAVAVTIEWPSGKTQRIDEVETNRLHMVREPRGART